MEDIWESDSDIEDFDLIDRLRAPKSRKFQPRNNYLAQLSDEEFLIRFRMSKTSFNILLSLIEAKIGPKTAR